MVAFFNQGSNPDCRPSPSGYCPPDHALTRSLLDLVLLLEQAVAPSSNERKRSLCALRGRHALDHCSKGICGRPHRELPLPVTFLNPIPPPSTKRRERGAVKMPVAR
jgi:hypothetical protein